MSTRRTYSAHPSSGGSAMSTATMTGRHYVAGQWLSLNGDTFASRSPANKNRVVGTFPAGNAAVANDAVAAAKAAFPMWRRTSRIHRAECFDRLARLIDRET